MRKGYTIPILGNSFVRYLRHLGADRDIQDASDEILKPEMAITEAARISYQSPSKGEEKDKGLLRYLFKNAHSSPFEMVNISFNIRMPIFVMRQFVRHRTFRLNEVSARYTELDLGFYVPKKWRYQDNKNKQSSIDAKINSNYQRQIHNAFTEWAEESYAESLGTYKKLLASNVAREMARIVLPVGALTEIVVNIDMNNLIKFFLLRDDNHAQYEIVQVARAMKEITRKAFPWVMELYDDLQADKEKLAAFMAQAEVISMFEDFEMA